MESNKNKNMWILAGVVVVVLVLAYAFMNKNKGEEVVVDTNSVESGLTDTSSPEGTKGTNAIDTATKPAVKMSYADALVKYKDLRIQFDTKCQATPNASTYKNGTSIMLDNRSAETRKITFGSTYTVKPYDFQIVKLTSTTLPKTWYVDCGKQLNVTTILLQK